MLYHKCLPVLLVAVWVAISSVGHARILPTFDLDQAVMEAAYIVEGNFPANAALEVTQLYKGTLHLPVTCKLANGTFENFTKTMADDTPASCVAFMQEPRQDGEYPLVSGFAGLVVISKSGKVYAWLPAFTWGNSAIQSQASWTAASFLGELKSAKQRTDQLAALLAKSRTAERTRLLIRFLETEAPWRNEDEDSIRGTIFHQRGYLFSRVRSALFQPFEEEERTLLELIRDATTDENRARVLALVAGIKPSKKLYQTILPWIETKTPSIVRNEAIKALLACDAYEGAGVLSRYLVASDPHLKTIVQSLSNSGWSREANVHHLLVVDALRKLGPVALERSTPPETDATNQGWAVLGLIQNYIHPELLPLLFEWSSSATTSTSAQAKSNLRHVLGISQSATSDDQVQQWWKETRAKMQTKFNLANSDGIEAWLTAWWSDKNPMTRHVMLYLWDFEPAIPERELLALCDGKHAEAAKHALAELWQRKRLSAAARKEIVRRYVKMKIVMERSRYNKIDAPGEVTIVSERRFPFPEAAWINTTGDLAANREPAIDDPNSGGSWSLTGKGMMGFYSTSGTGDRSVKGIVEVWEKDYQTSPPKELWRLRWRLAQTYKEKEVEVSAEPD